MKPEDALYQAVPWSARYPDEKIVRITRSSLYYTVGLANSKELKYDRLGIFQGELTKEEAEAFGAEALAEADNTDETQH